MKWASSAQRDKFLELAKEGKIDPKEIERRDNETVELHRLPERVRRKGRRTTHAKRNASATR